MFAFLFVVFAVVTRVVPHAWLNFTAVGASLLYFGARRSRLQSILPLVLFAATDYFLTVFAYRYPFHLQDYLITWAWYLGVILLGSAILKSRTTPVRVVGAALASSTSFFLITNFAAWIALSGLYPRSVAGLMESYAAGLPFYARDLVSTTLFAGAAFGLPVLLRTISEARHGNATIAS